MDMTGTNAATLGKKVYEYYYGYTTLEQVLGSGASSVSNVTSWRLMFHVKRGGSSMQDGNRDQKQQSRYDGDPKSGHALC